MDAPLIRDGAIAIRDGRIIDVGTFGNVRARRSECAIDDLGDAVTLPGLVNAHTHLELSGVRCTPLAHDETFTDWVLRVGAGARVEPEALQQSVDQAVRDGAAQCLKFGVTTVGDISQHIRYSRAALRSLEQRPRVVSFAEVLGLSKRRWRFDELLQGAMSDRQSDDMLRPGLQPHAPYSVDRPGYETCLNFARELDVPLATHLSETPHERAFIESHAGPFRELLDRIGSFEEPVETFHGSPIAFAHAIGLLDYPTLLAHVNYCDDDEFALLAEGHASVVYCPRTHAYFGHPPHRWREMLSRGINVAVGTDSCASSPDLNLVDDLRLIHRIACDVSAQQLFELATIRAARAVRMEAEVGSLTIGKRADFTVFAARPSSVDPLLDILESPDQLPTQTRVSSQR